MNAPNPTAAGLRHRAATRRRARFGLLAFTAASVAFNVTVILQLPDYTLVRLALAALAPITLAYMGHLLAGYLQSDMLLSGTAEKVNKWTRRAVAAIAFGAFALSFQTLYAAAVPDHGGFAFVFPLTLDLAIGVCTWMLVVIARADEHDQAAGVTPHLGWYAARRERRNPAPVQVAATTAPQPAEQVAEPVRVTPAVHAPRRDAHQLPATPPIMPAVRAPEVQPAPLPRPAAPQPGVTVETQLAEPVPAPAPQLPRDDAPPAVQHPGDPAERTLTWDDADTGPIAVQPVQRPDPAVHRNEEQGLDDVAPQGEDTAPQGDPRPEEPAEQPVEDAPRVAPTPPRFEVHRGGLAPAPRPAAEVTRDPETPRPVGAHRDIAERLVRDGRTKASMEQVEKVLAMAADGASQRVIASTVGISATAVGRILDAARELEAAPVA